MKKYTKKCLQKSVKGFTLMEMLVVLLIISVLLLLFVPNLSQQKDKVKSTGGAAVVRVVESQAELYELDSTGKASLSTLVSEGHITAKQAEAYNEYYQTHPNEVRQVAS